VGGVMAALPAQRELMFESALKIGAASYDWVYKTLIFNTDAD